MAAADRELLLRTARLARLSLDPARVDRLAEDFARILEAFQGLAAVDVDEGAPAEAPEACAAPREDAPRPTLDRAELLANAPEPAGEFFGVPKTVETDG